jgi:hypothetical protein
MYDITKRGTQIAIKTNTKSQDEKNLMKPKKKRIRKYVSWFIYNKRKKTRIPKNAM